MRAGARSLASALLAGSVLAAACQPQAPASGPPERELTLCERPARPAAMLQDPQVEASFRTFADSWLVKLRKAKAATNTRASRTQILPQLETELHPTGSAQAPWAGVLRYCEQTLRCSGPKDASCQPRQSTVVTEIFRFQAGQWVY